MDNKGTLNVLLDNSGSMNEQGRPFLLRNILYTIKDYFELNQSSFIPKFYLFSEKIIQKSTDNEISFSPAGKVDWVELESFLNKSGENSVNLVVSDFSFGGSNLIYGKKISKWIKDKKIRALNVSDFIRDKNLFCPVENIIAMLDAILEDDGVDVPPSNICDIKQASIGSEDNGDWE